MCYIFADGYQSVGHVVFALQRLPKKKLAFNVKFSMASSMQIQRMKALGILLCETTSSRQRVDTWGAVLDKLHPD